MTKPPKAPSVSFVSAIQPDIEKFQGGERGVALPAADDDRRYCTQCLNLRGRVCTIAKPGAQVSANRGYQPMRDVRQRCAGYQPDSHDTDQRSGSERWPGLTDTNREE